MMVSTEGTPPRLAYQAREGVVVVDERETPPSRISSEGGGGGSMSTEELLPPSRVWSEGGGSDGVNEGTPPRLAFQAREGWWSMGGKPLRLAFRAREGLEGVDAATRRREMSLSLSCWFCKVLLRSVN